MSNFKEDHPEFDADYFDAESFFSLEYYREHYDRTEKETILYFHQNKHRYDELQKGFPKLSIPTLKTLACKSASSIHYEEKLAIWKENNASPFDAEYLFKMKIKSKKKPLTVVASILPKNEMQKNLYLQLLIEYISEQYRNNNDLFGAEVFAYHDLKAHFLKNKVRKPTEEMKSIVDKCRQIEKDCSLSVDFMDYIFYLNSYHNNLSSLKIELKDRIENLWTLAIELSFYDDYAKYYLFLEKFDDSNQKEKRRYISESANKTFKKADYFDDVKLYKLHKLLVNANYISEINYDDFKKVFTEREMKHGLYHHPKINWKLKNRGMDKQSLLTLIDYVVSPDYTEENKSTISKIIRACFTFENKDILDKIEKSFGEAFKSFKKKNYRNSEKIENIMDKII